MRIIEASPGIHVSKLCRESELSWGTIQYHLKWMAQQGRIQVHRTGRLLQIFPASDRAAAAWLGVLRDAIPNQILDRLNQRPGLGVQDLSRSLGVSRKTVRRHLTDLLEAGLVDRQGGYRGQFLPRSER